MLEGKAGVEASAEVELVLGAAAELLGVESAAPVPAVPPGAEATSAAARIAACLTVPVAAAEGDAGVATVGGVPVAGMDGA